MKNAINLTRCLAAVLLLSVSACVKDSNPDTPHPPALGWLLTRVDVTVKYGDPEGGPVSYDYSRYDYEYNQHYMPSLRRYYFGEDSNQMVLRRVDTLSYDNKLRPIRKGVKPETGAPYEVTYTYTGDDVYPTTEGSTKFVYQDTVVYEISAHSDTTIHIYNRQGNYLGILDPDFEFYPIHGEYDNHPNPGRFLNLKFSRILNIPEADRGPLFSTNNWLLTTWEFLEYRQITTDAEGKVTKSVARYIAPGRLITSVYHYTKPN